MVEKKANIPTKRPPTGGMAIKPTNVEVLSITPDDKDNAMQNTAMDSANSLRSVKANLTDSFNIISSNESGEILKNFA